MQNEQKIFKLHSEYAPTGDQPQAIEALVKGFQEGNQFQTLLGVTGSGKTFTMANIIRQLQRLPAFLVCIPFSHLESLLGVIILSPFLAFGDLTFMITLQPDTFPLRLQRPAACMIASSGARARYMVWKSRSTPASMH